MAGNAAGCIEKGVWKMTMPTLENLPVVREAGPCEEK